MAKKEIKIPSPGESVKEMEIASWLVSDGDYVEKDQELAEVESDKATLQLLAEASGSIEIKIDEGKTTEPGAVACLIDTSAEKPAGAKKEEKPDEKPKQETASKDKAEKNEIPAEKTDKDSNKEDENERAEDLKHVKTSPLARKKMEEHGLDVEDVIKGLRRLSADNVDRVLEQKEQQADMAGKAREGSRGTERKRMSMLRRKLSERLVGVKNETAMLTTFNEADMSAIRDIREKYQRKFQKAHDVKLGFMSFFVKASALALRQYPQVNAMIDGEDIVSHHYADIGIAVQTPKGLMVPVIRNAEALGLAETEKEILRLAGLAREGKIGLDDLNGGTFSITNGGVFGSQLSTPIINPPQAAILGMHNIQDRPVAERGQVVVRPMMYLALSYDHRLVDGKDSVSFLVHVKDLLENPLAMLSPEGETYSGLLDL